MGSFVHVYVHVHVHEETGPASPVTEDVGRMKETAGQGHLAMELVAEGVGEVGDVGFAVFGEHDGDDVEAVVEGGVVLFGDESFGGAADVFLFFVGDVYFGIGEVVGAAGFDFDERDGVALLSDEVDFVGAEDGVAGEDFETLAAEELCGEAFALLPEGEGRPAKETREEHQPRASSGTGKRRISP